MTYEEIIQHGGNRIEPKIYYYNNNETTIISRDEIKLMRPHFETNIIGTIMRGVEVELTIQLPLNVKIYVENTALFGTYSATKQFGSFYIKDETYNADTKTYTYNLYDEMLNLMVDYKGIDSYAFRLTQDNTFVEDKTYYELVNGEYVEYTGDRTGNPSQLSLYESNFPMTVRNFLVTFLASINYSSVTADIDNLPNAGRQIQSDIYKGIGFTNRDVLEDIGQANGVLFGINEDKEVYICRKGTTTKVIDDDILMNQNISMGEHYGPINTIVLSRAAGADNVYYPDPLPANPIEFRIENNQLMNNDDRSDYLPALYNQLNGLEYDIYDCELTGFGGFEPLDKLQINTIENNTTKTYNSYAFNNDIQIAQGYGESIYNELPQKAATDFKYASATDKAIKRAEIIANKQEGEISEIVSKLVDDELVWSETKRIQDELGERFEVATRNIDENGNVTEITTVNGYTFNQDGLNIYTNENGFNTQITNTAVKFKDGNNVISETNKDGVISKDFKQQGLHQYSWDGDSYEFSDERVEIDGEYGYATFYNGD